MTNTLLVTGSLPFAGLANSPSTSLLVEVEGMTFHGLTVSTQATDVNLATVVGAVRGLVARHRPAAYVALGLAAGEPVLRCETTAINRLDFATADNYGDRPTDGRPIDPAGPAARLATWDAAGLAQAIRDAGLPARVSHNAGTHLCNATLYSALGAMEAEGLSGPTGFFHVPYLPQQVVHFLETAPPEGDLAPFTARALPSMSLVDQRAALVVLLDRLATHATGAAA